MADSQQPEEEYRFGAEVNLSSMDDPEPQPEPARIFASTEKLELELEMKQMMIHIYNHDILPMIRKDVNAEYQKMLSQLKQEFPFALLTNSCSCNTGNTSVSKSLQLQFINGISTPVFTGMDIEGKDHKPFVVALVDGITGQIVDTGAEAAAKVEIVVLKGDCDDSEVESWTLEDFNSKILDEWKGKKILKGNTSLNLKGGVVAVNKISFIQSSSWTKNNKCRLGAKFEDAVFANTVKQAWTESFLIRDKRCLLYSKHEIPFLSDELWRLRKIRRGGAYHNYLTKAGINTVKDFMTLLAINPERLKDILGVDIKTWNVIINHAQTCKDDDEGVYMYPDPRSGQKPCVAFNFRGQLTGLITECKYFPADQLSEDNKVYARYMVASASENWEAVVSFNDEASLINECIQSDTACLSQNLRSSNGTDLVSPIDDLARPTTSFQVTTHLNSKWYANNVNNSGLPSMELEHDNVYTTDSGNPANSATSKQLMSNPPKKRRVDHPQINASTVNVIPPVHSIGGSSSSTNMNVPETFNQRPMSFQFQTPNSSLDNPNLLTEVVGDNDFYLQYINFEQPDVSWEARRKWKIMLRLVEWKFVISKIRKKRTTTTDGDNIVGNCCPTQTTCAVA